MTHPQPWTQWVDIDTIHQLYADGIARYGGSGSPSKDGCIDAALGAAYNAEIYSMPEVEGEELTSGLVFCGYLLFYITTKHCFMDGNKRVAWLTAMWILLGHGLTVQATDDEAETFCMDIAKGTIDKGEDVVNWIAARLVPIT